MWSASSASRQRPPAESVLSITRPAADISAQQQVPAKRRTDQYLSALEQLQSRSGVRRSSKVVFSPCLLRADNRRRGAGEGDAEIAVEQPERASGSREDGPRAKEEKSRQFRKRTRASGASRWVELIVTVGDSVDPGRGRGAHCPLQGEAGRTNGSCAATCGRCATPSTTTRTRPTGAPFKTKLDSQELSARSGDAGQRCGHSGQEGQVSSPLPVGPHDRQGRVGVALHAGRSGFGLLWRGKAFSMCIPSPWELPWTAPSIPTGRS